MSGGQEEPPLTVDNDALADDLLGVTWQYRAVTMLLTVGILTFGVMLGSHLMAADLLFGYRLPDLQPRYVAVMKGGTVVSGLSLVLAVALDQRDDDNS